MKGPNENYNRSICLEDMLAAGAMLLTGCMTLGVAAGSIDYATLVVLAPVVFPF